VKVVIQAKEKRAEAIIDERFGRCGFFAVYDTDKKDFEFFENPFKDGGGAGIKAAQLVADKGEALIGVNFGPNAFAVLSESGMKVYSGLREKTLKENIDIFLEQKLEEIKDSNAEKHSGLM